ncbi:hypothetical protein EMCG_04257 [[Emmonsia] crescens]|uniref:Uncharacterized protein n=1 Tax=[Emmonsia] crescens TaxID=73230 RepID=A0A0G2HSL1_9EURO|nr:hypothetical protein EMCG_04257 [Emmonsia crescens UAMH 3008]
MDKISLLTRGLLKNNSVVFQGIINQIAEGKNPHGNGAASTKHRSTRSSQFDYRSVQWRPWGPIVAHLFNDGTIKTSTEMHEENNQ